MAKYKIFGNGVFDNERGATIPNDVANRHWLAYQKWVSDGNTVDPADPDPPPPTNDEIYDQVLTNPNQKVFKAYVLAVNDGSITPGMTNAALKTAVKAKM